VPGGILVLFGVISAVGSSAIRVGAWWPLILIALGIAAVVRSAR